MTPLRTEVDRHPSRIFRRAATRVATAWALLGGLVLIATAITHPQHWSLFLVLVIASGVVSLVALLPGMLLPAVRPAATSGTAAGLFMVGCTAAMAIRAVGTVALVVACRYKIVAESSLGFPGGGSYPGGGYPGVLETASLIIGLLYVGTTIVEVQRLASGGRSLDRRRPVGFVGQPSR